MSESVTPEERSRLEIEQARTAIIRFLHELDISRIVYIDDRCSINELRELFIGKLKAKYSSKPRALDFIDWELPSQVFDSSVIELWDSADDNRRRELFHNVLLFEDDEEDLQNSVAPLKLKQQLNDRIDLLSPSEWVARRDEIIASLNERSKILFLFDIEFENSPLADGRNGIALASELLLTQGISEFVYCGLFSHLFNIEEEYEKRNEFCNTSNLQFDRFYTISKKRFQDDSYLPALAEGIRNTLCINEIEDLKKLSSKVLRKSFKDSLSEIKELTPESFNHIIQKSSLEEGIWEMATLIRVNGIISKNKALNRLLSENKRSKINDQLLNIRKLEKIKTGSDSPYDKTQIQNLRHQELYYDSAVINELHFPTSNGDIFKINDLEYILLAQPCNLALRKDGKRSRNYDKGFLIKIDEVSHEEFASYKKRKLTSLGVIETVNSRTNISRIAQFSSFEAVSLLPLDLTVFNKDGIARINLNESENSSSTIQESWKKRYKRIHKSFTSYKDSIATFKLLRSSKKNDLKELIYYGEMFKGYNLNNDNVLSNSNALLTFQIERVASYKEPYSSDLLQKFMQYLSRNAFDHDFLNT